MVTRRVPKMTDQIEHKLLMFTKQCVEDILDQEFGWTETIEDENQKARSNINQIYS